MAFVDKYTTTYCDKFGRTCIVKIQEDNFGGAPTELKAQTDPFLVSYSSTEDFQYDPIRSSTATINLVLGDGVDLDEFYTANDRQYKILHTIGGGTDWVGWLLPGGFEKQLTGGLYEATIEASDGLAGLEARPFINDATGENYGVDDLGYLSGYQDPTNLFRFRQILVLTECLKKTDLELAVHVAVDVEESTASTKDTGTETDCPLVVTEVNVRTYIGDSDREDIPYWRDAGEALNTYEVLEATCQLWGAKIYQENGRWVFKRVNADLDFGTAPNARYYHIFSTTTSSYIGRSALTDQRLIPCYDRVEPKGLIGTDHSQSVDDVFKRFRVNYKYQYGREGDNFLNVIKNGDFAEAYTNSTASSAPPKWRKYRRTSTTLYPRTQRVAIAQPSSAGGNAWAIEFGTGVTSGTDQYANPDSALEYSVQDFFFKQGDEIVIRFWFRTQYLPTSSTDWQVYGPVISVWLNAYNPEEGNKRYFLSLPTQQSSSGDYRGGQWYDWDGGQIQKLFRPLTFYMTDQYRDGDRAYGSWNTPRWASFTLPIQPLPDGGQMRLRFHGVTESGINANNTGRPFPSYWVFNGVPEINENYQGSNDIPYAGGGYPALTGVAMGIVPQENEREEYASYIAENPDPAYTLQRKPTTVLHGDNVNPLAISKLYIVGQADDYRGKWDDLDGTFGLSSLGLNLARSVMQLYSTPGVIMEGDVQAQDLNFGTVFEFDAIPGIRFVLQRATFSRKWGLITDASFYEIGAGSVTGGTEDGADTTADYQPTPGEDGIIARCQTDGGGLNTGFLEVRTEDINPASPTFGQVIWEQGNQNTTQCPIGQAQSFLVGFSGATLNTADVQSTFYLQTVPSDGFLYFKVSNPGDLYFYICHLPSLGTITEVKTDNQDDIEDDFAYQADTLIGGVTYKVFRQNYPTTAWQKPVAIKF